MAAQLKKDAFGRCAGGLRVKGIPGFSFAAEGTEQHSGNQRTATTDYSGLTDFKATKGTKKQAHPGNGQVELHKKGHGLALNGKLRNILHVQYLQPWAHLHR